MKLFSLRSLTGALVATFLTLSAVAQTQPGQIKAARLEGEVTKITAASVETPLVNGELLTETDTVVTGEKGSVVLVFTNGSTVRIAPNSRLRVDKFQMDPLADGTDLSKLTEEPSPSQTELNLAFGEIVGNVKKLKGTSNYSIKTPVGAAGIRGTTFRIVFRPTGDGRAFNFQVTTAEGLVVFEGTTAGSGPVEVPADQEIIVTVTVENGQATISGPVQTQTISPEAQQQIQQVVTQVAEAVQQTTFTPAPPSTTPPPNTPPADPPPPPPPTTTAPPLTSGAGQG